MKISPFAAINSLFRLLLILLLSLSTIHASEITLSGTIVIPEKATPLEQKAAQEIQSYFQKLGIKKTEVITENAKATPEPGSVYVGETVLAKKVSPQQPPSPESWSVQGHQGHLLLRGGTPRGILYAASHFLEDVLGIHWWSASGAESLPPSIPSIASTLLIKGTPAFRSREIYDALSDTPERRDFLVRNRQNADSRHDNFRHSNFVNGLEATWTERFGLPQLNHTFHQYLPVEEYFDKNPEFFAQDENGIPNKRTPQLSYPAPGLSELILKKLYAHIEKSESIAKAAGIPAPRYYDLSQNDFSGFYCHSPASLKRIKEEGAVSAPMIDFVNKIAREIKKTHPHLMLSTLAYLETTPPPQTLKIEDNVVIRLCTFNNNFAKPFNTPENENFRTYLKGWRKAAKHVWLYHYTLSFNPSSTAANFCTINLEADLRFCRDNGIEGVFIEHENGGFSSNLFDLDHWVTLKLIEDPSRTFESLAEIFCNGYYGAAGPLIFDYVKMLKVASKNNRDFHPVTACISDFSYLTPEFMERAEKLWEKAEAACTPQSNELKRVKEDRFYFDRTLLGVAQKLADESLKSKKTTWSLSYAKIADRSLQLLEKRPLAKDRFPEEFFTAEKVNHEIEKLKVYRQIPWAESTPLPEKITKAANGAFAVFYPGTYRLEGPQNKLVIDPLLPTRLAVSINCNVKTATDSSREEATDISGRVYDMQAMKPTFELNVPYDLLSETEYKWFQLGNGKLREADYLYLQKDWGIQASLGTFLNSTPEKNCKIWGEFRKKTEEQLIFLNRIVAAKNPNTTKPNEK